MASLPLSSALKPSDEPAPMQKVNLTMDEAAVAVYAGRGTEEEPFEVCYAPGDATDPRNWRTAAKWMYTIAANLSLTCISVSATMYASGTMQMSRYFGVSTEVVTLGLSVYQLGFAVGPLFWAPLSEQFGRRPVFLSSFSVFVLLTLATSLAHDIQTLVVCRFFVALFGSSILVTSAAIIGDLFDASQRGPAMTVYAIAAFGGPVVGPIAGSFLDAAASHKWLFYTLLIFSGVCLCVGALVPETYGPPRLTRLAARLTESTGEVYRSAHSATGTTFFNRLKISLARPFQLFIREPIVTFFSIYTSLVYGLLYSYFGAFPWIFHEERGWPTNIASLPFLGVGVGMLVGVGLNLYLNKAYVRKTLAAGHQLPPEARLPLCIAGGVCLPISLLIFAFTAKPNVPWPAPVVVATPVFGFAYVSIFLSMTAYLLDAYPFFAASALACTASTRSIAGAVFPLFIRLQFAGMTTQWSLFLYACIAMLCAPVPFLLYHYGERIRAKSRFAPVRANKDAEVVAAPPAGSEETVVDPV